MGILTNNEGKILRSNQTGSVLKQNYNFNNYFNGKPEYLENADFNLTNFTVYLWYDSFEFGSVVYGLFNLENTNTQTIIDHSFRVGSNYWRYKQFGGVDNDTSIGGGYTGLNLLIVKYDYNNNDLQFKIQGKRNVTFSSANNPPASSFNILRFCAGYYTDTSLNIGDYNIIESTVFNRVTSESEDLYYFNNNLGNEPLILSGLTNKYIFNSAENINDNIVVKDQVGTKHLNIVGLPAGTLQEQLDYANANLFEAW